MYKIACSILVTMLLQTPVLANGDQINDSRALIYLTTIEKDWLMDQMRSQLISIKSIINAIGLDDRSKAAKLAMESGTIKTKLVSQPPEIKNKVTDEWRSYASSMYKSFDDISSGISDNDDIQTTLKKMAGLMDMCTACHQSYRVVVANN